MKTLTLNFKGREVIANRDAWFNATQISGQFNKRLNKFFERKRNQDYIHAVASGHNPNNPFSGDLKRPFNIKDYPLIIKTQRGNNGGTWLHPDLMVCFARWISLDFEIWCDKTIKDLLINDKDWQAARTDSKIGFNVMSEVLQARRLADGLPVKPYHYSNEAMLCNAALTGKFAALERDNLPQQALAMLNRLQARNAALIGHGWDYQRRKENLFEMAAAVRLNLQSDLIGVAA